MSLTAKQCEISNLNAKLEAGKEKLLELLELKLGFEAEIAVYHKGRYINIETKCQTIKLAMH